MFCDGVCLGKRSLALALLGDSATVRVGARHFEIAVFVRVVETNASTVGKQHATRFPGFFE